MLPGPASRNFVNELALVSHPRAKEIPDQLGDLVFTFLPIGAVPHDVQSQKVDFILDKLNLSPGVYTLGFWIADYPSEVYDWIKFGMNLEVVDPNAGSLGFRADGVVICNFSVKQM